MRGFMVDFMTFQPVCIIPNRNETDILLLIFIIVVNLEKQYPKCSLCVAQGYKVVSPYIASFNKEN